MFQKYVKMTVMSVCLVGSFTMNLMADPPGLKKMIEADYDDVTLKKALDEFKDETEISMVLSPDLPFRERVNITVEKASAHKILNWLCEQSDIDYIIDGDVLIIGTKNDIDERRSAEFRKRLVSKRYYIVDLLGELKDFQGPEISLAGGEEGGGGISIEESSSETDEPISGDDLVEMIVDSIEPESWDNDNGTYISIRNGGINVRTTPEIHEKINDLINSHRKSKSRMVAVTARIHQVASEDIESLMESIDGQVLSADGVKLLAKHKLIHYGRNIGHSSQRFTITSLRQIAYIRDLTAVVNVQTGVLDPDIGYIQAGLSVDVRPTASHDGKTVLLENRTTYTQILKSKIEQLKDESHIVSADGVKTTSKTERRIEMPQMDTGAVRSTLRIPVDKWVPFVMSEKDGMYVVLTMRCSVIDR